MQPSTLLADDNVHSGASPEQHKVHQGSDQERGLSLGSGRDKLHQYRDKGVQTDRQVDGRKRYRVFLRSKKMVDNKRIDRVEIVISDEPVLSGQVIKIGQSGWEIISHEKDPESRPQLGDRVIP